MLIVHLRFIVSSSSLFLLLSPQQSTSVDFQNSSIKIPSHRVVFFLIFPLHSVETFLSLFVHANEMSDKDEVHSLIQVTP